MVNKDEYNTNLSITVFKLRLIIGQIFASAAWECFTLTSSLGRIILCEYRRK